MSRPILSSRDLAGAIALAAALAGVILMAAPDRCGAQAPDSSQDSARPSTPPATHRRIQPLPALGSAPETGLQYGATMLAVWQPAAERRTRPTSVLAFALRTAENQTRIGVEADHWTAGNQRRLAATLMWQEFPLPYFGVGDRAAEASREQFTPRGFSGTVTLQQRLRGPVYVTAGLLHADQRMAIEAGGALATGNVLGSRGGRTSEWTLGLLSDTRDNVFAPHAGHWVQVGYSRSDDALWSDFDYGRVRLDARAYRTVRGEHVVASQLLLVGLDGRPPFDRMALVGGSDILRGYAMGRYRDRVLMATQAEYRSPLIRRVGAVLFVGAGVSSPSLTALGQRIVLPSYGAGLRGQIDRRQRTSIRVDYGRGRDGASGLYIGFNQAF